MVTVRRLNRFARGAAGVVALMGFSVLAGWVFGVETLKSLNPGAIAMNPLSAISFILLGTCLFGLTLPSLRLWPKALASVVAAAGLLRLIATVSFDAGLDTILFRSVLAGNRMALNTAACFTLCAISVLLFNRKWAGVWISEYLTVVCLAIASLAITGYFYGVDALYGFRQVTPMALNTCLTFFVFSLGIFAARPREGVAGLFVRNDLGGRILRQLFPLITFVPLAFGALALYGRRAEIFSNDFSVSLVVVGTTMVLALVTWRAARSLSDTDGALIKQTQVLKSVLQSMGDGVVVVDPDHNCILYNPAADRLMNASMLASSPAEWEKGQGLYAADDKRPMPREEMPLALALQGFESDLAEAYYETTDGSKRAYLNITSRAVRGSEGDVWGAVAVIHDVTEAKQLLVRAEQKVQQLQKLDAIGRLAGGIAHDFNNILAIVQMQVEAMRESLENPVEISDSLVELERALGRGAGLTRQLLIFSRTEASIEARLLDLNEILQSHVRMLRRLIGENIQIEILPSPSLPSLRADSGQIEQVIMNLVINARDAMPTGGQIKIETSKVTLNSTELASDLGVPIGDYVMLSVSDTGHGMDEKTKLKVFEPFFTTKPAGKGTGLGLSTVFEIVKSFNGAIWLDSELGKGTTFKIYFPAVHGAAESTPDAVHSVDVRGSETILVVEDEQVLRDLYLEILAHHGYNAIGANNGSSALGILAANSGKVSLVITDMIMPKMGGPELAKEAHVLYPDLKFLFMSGYPGEHREAVAMSGLRAEFIQKPFNAYSLTLRVRTLLDT